MAHILNSVIAANSFNPKTIYGIKLWLDAQDAATVTVVGNAITQVTSKAGSTMGPATTGFTYPNNSFNGTNLPSFKGPVAPNSGGSLGQASISTGNSTTVVMVLQRTAAYGAATFAISGQGSGPGSPLYLWDPGAPNFYQTGQIAGDSTGQSRNAFVVTAVCGPTPAMYINNVSYGTQFNAANMNMTSFVIGNGYTTTSLNAFSGHICEVIIYDGIVSDADRTNLVGYLRQKWQL